MVLLAKWLLEDDPEARILVITDRDELDDQITKVLKNAGLDSTRVTSRADLVEKIGATTPRLLCALIHKFDTTDLTGCHHQPMAAFTCSWTKRTAPRAVT
jgi:type I restriction enzyme R subunit